MFIKKKVAKVDNYTFLLGILPNLAGNALKYSRCSLYKVKNNTLKK